MNSTEKVAEVISDWFSEYASIFAFDGEKEFEDFDLEQMKEVNVNKLWELVSPKLKELVVDYVECAIEDKTE